MTSRPSFIDGIASPLTVVVCTSSRVCAQAARDAESVTRRTWRRTTGVWIIPELDTTGRPKIVVFHHIPVTGCRQRGVVPHNIAGRQASMGTFFTDEAKRKIVDPFVGL